MISEIGFNCRSIEILSDPTFSKDLDKEILASI